MLVSDNFASWDKSSSEMLALVKLYNVLRLGR